MINANFADENEYQTYSIENAFDLVKSEVDAALSTSPSLMREYTGYLTGSSGKYIRAMSVLACALDSQDRVHENAVKLGSSIEILHLATLVHDDVIDNAEMRRGQISLQKKYGKRAAVICGDYLLCLALILAGSISNKKEYVGIDMPDYMSRVCKGEMDQEINNGNYDLSVLRYLKIISGKTAALFEAAFHAGAIISDKELPSKTVKQYARLGHYVGMIFQLTDDCMDFESTVDIALKPVQSDYEQDVITLPLIHAFNKKPELRERVKAQRLAREEINAAVSVADGLEYTRALAKKYYDKAVAIINGFEFTGHKRAAILSILDKAFRTF